MTSNLIIVKGSNKIRERFVLHIMSLRRPTLIVFTLMRSIFVYLNELKEPFRLDIKPVGIGLRDLVININVERHSTDI